MERVEAEEETEAGRGKRRHCGNWKGSRDKNGKEGESREREHKKEINVGPTTYRKTGYIWAYKREKE